MKRSCTGRRATAVRRAWLCAALVTAVPFPGGSVAAEDANAIVHLTVEQARTLAAGKSVQLRHLSTISPEAASALAACKGELSLGGLTTLGPEVAGALEGYQGRMLSLNGLSALTPAEAERLAKCRARTLMLNGLKELPAEVAKPLASFKGTLILGGLTEIDAEAAEPLAARKEKVWLMSLQSLPSVGIARKVMECESEVGVILPPITAFTAPDSVAIARYLAATDGPLELPKLRKISPKTLSALLEKRALRIPPIETLELIKEPDGSRTEDFIVPEWFEQR
jgi:hypothetical protein